MQGLSRTEILLALQSTKRKYDHYAILQNSDAAERVAMTCGAAENQVDDVFAEEEENPDEMTQKEYLIDRETRMALAEFTRKLRRQGGRETPRKPRTRGPEQRKGSSHNQPEKRRVHFDKYCYVVPISPREQHPTQHTEFRRPPSSPAPMAFRVPFERYLFDLVR